MHYTTFVLADLVERPTPVLVFGPDRVGEIVDLPLVTSLHVIGNEAMPMIHASMFGYAVPVTDLWVSAARAYENAAKIVLLQQSVPADIDTSYADLAQGVRGADLPPWLPMMVGGALKFAMREVPVTFGGGPADIGVVLEHHHSVATWAEQLVGFGDDRA